jgi:SAM-dependent methyltransferase
VEDDLKPLYDHLEGHGERWPQLLARLERGAEAREALEAYTEKLEVRLKEMSETVKQQGYGIDGIRDQIAKDRPVFNRLKDSWLHPDYYYKNIVGVMEDRQRLLHKAIGLLDDNSRVLDIGPGNCFAMEGFLANGHRAEGVGLELESYIPKEVRERYKLIEADYNTWEVDEPYDAIFASHVLEHQPNNLAFVQKMYRDLREGGWLFVLVPPMKAEVVGGHLNLFNTGYLVYSLIVGGFDCSEAMVTKYGYNVVCFVRKKSFEMPKLRYDSGDIETLAPYFPFEATQNFNGLHVEANWKW